jgi:hypothetical protein
MRTNSLTTERENDNERMTNELFLTATLGTRDCSTLVRGVHSQYKSSAQNPTVKQIRKRLLLSLQETEIKEKNDRFSVSSER